MLLSRSRILAKAICTTIRPKFRVPTHFFHMHTTIWQKYMGLFHLIFLLCTTIRPKISVLIDLFLLRAYDHSTEIYGPLSFILSSVHDHSTKAWGHWSISFICTRLFDKIYDPLSFFLSLCTTIRPEIRVHIDLYLLFVHDHSTKN